jgi:hypothetical protein
VGCFTAKSSKPLEFLFVLLSCVKEAAESLLYPLRVWLQKFPFLSLAFRIEEELCLTEIQVEFFVSGSSES